MADLSLLPATASIEGPDLRVGGCSLADVAAEFGTPAFVIDEEALRGRAAAYRDGLGEPASAQPGVLRDEVVPLGVDGQRAGQ